MQKKKTSCLWWFLSPTYKFAEYKKIGLTDPNPKDLSKTLKTFNLGYFFLAISICIVVQVIVSLGHKPFHEYSFDTHPIIKYLPWLMVIVIVWGFLLSRAVEITKAFLDDAIGKLNGERSNSDLRYGERLKLALTSYIELIVNFGTLYFLMPLCFYKDSYQFKSVLEAIYFSGVTITTVGYGDISPSYWFLQFLTIFEVLAGFSLIIVCFTIYTSLALSPSTICKICGRKLGREHNKIKKDT